MSEQRSNTETPALGRRAAMQEVRANRDEERAEAAAKRAQRKPGRSGEYNPGGNEYLEELPKGPGGTAGALDSGRPQHEKADE